MRTYDHFKPFIWLIMFGLLVGLACSVAGGTASTSVPPTPLASPIPPPTKLLPTPGQPTNPPPPTQPPSGPQNPTAPPANPSAPAFEISPDLYQHADGLFELTPPKGWEPKEDSGSVSFIAPDDSGYIYYQATNTDYTLDEASFENFIDAREVNFFGGFDNYQEISRDINPDKSVATISKSFDFASVPQIVTTIYDQKENVVFTLDFWADEDKFDAYSAQYDVIIDSTTVDRAVASNLDVYLWIYDFNGPADLFTIEVPTPWRYERDTGETAIVDTFYSPDEHGVIQNVTYDDGEPVSKSDAGAFALNLLKSFYADDIKITDDKVQSDGSERLIWNSPGGDYTGISFFETRGTTFLLFTVMYDNPFEDTYLDVLDYIVSTYDVP